MQINLRAFGELKKRLGHQLTLPLDEGSEVGDLLRLIGEKLGAPDKLVSPEGEIAENLSVLVNGLSVNVGAGAREPLSDGDVVSLLPPAGGG